MCASGAGGWPRRWRMKRSAHTPWPWRWQAGGAVGSGGRRQRRVSSGSRRAPPSTAAIRMEEIATAAETAALLRRHPGSRFLLFPEDRAHPIGVRADVPLRRAQRGGAAEFTAQACPREFFVFQPDFRSEAAGRLGAEGLAPDHDLTRSRRRLLLRGGARLTLRDSGSDRGRTYSVNCVGTATSGGSAALPRRACTISSGLARTSPYAYSGSMRPDRR